MYTFLILGYNKTLKWVSVNARNIDDAEIKAVDVFNEVSGDIALKVFYNRERSLL